MSSAFLFTILLRNSVAPIPVMPPCPNDEPSGAVLVWDGATPTGLDMCVATAAVGEPSPGPGTGLSSCNSQDGWCSFETGIQNSIWYIYDIPAAFSGDATVSVTTLNTPDNQLAIYKTTIANIGNFASYQEIAADDDLATIFAAQILPVMVPITPGDVLLVQDDGFGGNTGVRHLSFTLALTPSTPPTPPPTPPPPTLLTPSSGSITCPIAPTTSGGSTIDCAGGSFAATGVTQLICDPIQSCQGTTFDVCSPNNGEIALKFEGFETFRDGYITAKKVSVTECKTGSSTCMGATFELTCLNKEGCDFLCDGVSTCEGTKVSINKLNQVKCSGVKSCYGMDLMAANAVKGSGLEFEGDEAAANAIIMANNVESIICKSGVGVCQNIVATFTGVNGEFNIDCQKQRACKDGQITINGVGRKITLKVKCAETDACDDLNIVLINTGGVDKDTILPECSKLDNCNGAEINGAPLFMYEPPAPFKIMGLNNNNNNNNGNNVNNTIFLISIVAGNIIIIVSVLIVLYWRKQKKAKQMDIEENAADIIANNSNINTDVKDVEIVTKDIEIIETIEAADNTATGEVI